MNKVPEYRYCATHAEIVRHGACRARRFREEKTEGLCDIVDLWFESSLVSLFDPPTESAGA